MSKMTIKECFDAAFQLLNQYSIAGTLVPLSYNDQADDRNRMLNLINDAQMIIAMGPRPIHESMTVVMPELDRDVLTAQVEVEMPDDYAKVLRVYFTAADQSMAGTGEMCPCNQVFTRPATQLRWLTDDTLLLPNRPAGTYLIEYGRYPVRYTSETPLTTELDNKPDTHNPIPYYVAAMIAMDENPKMYYYLYNQWETMLSRLVEHETPYAQVEGVCDVYGFNHFLGVY